MVNKEQHFRKDYRNKWQPKLTRVVVVLMIVLLSTGFRVMTNYDGTVSRWYINKNDPTIWLNFCDETANFVGNDLPSSDPFASGGILMDDVLQSILNDFNDVGASHFRLAFYPDDPDSPPGPQLGDSAFTKEAAVVRTINVCFGDLPYYAAAQAQTTTNESACEVIGSQSAYKDYCSATRIYSCEIDLNKGLSEESMRGFIHTLAHELGHCVGLLHTHDTHLSIMSYVADPDNVFRLQMDDKMGLTYLYPKQDNYNDEEATLGLTGCE